MMHRFVALLIALCPGAAFAQAAALTLDEVLQSSARSAPQIVESLAKVRQAEGKGLSANGAFDTVFDIDGRSREAGYYDGSSIESTVKRPSRKTAATTTAGTGPRAGRSRSTKTSPTPTAAAK